MNPNPTTVRKGRERSCIQCGTTFRSIRSNARFCSTQCRVAHHRGHEPRGGEKIRKRLTQMGFIGPIGPWNNGSPRCRKPTRHALLVPVAQAVSELNERYNRATKIGPKDPGRTLGEALEAKPVKHRADISEQEVRSALRRANVEII